MQHKHTFSRVTIHVVTAIPGSVNVLFFLPWMENRLHLMHLFKLSCVCLLESSQVLRAQVFTTSALDGPGLSQLSNREREVACSEVSTVEREKVAEESRQCSCKN